MHKEIKLVVTKVEETDFVEGDLDKFPDAYLTKVVVQDVLEFSNNKQILDLIASKVRKNGLLVLEGIDGLDMCRKVANGTVSLEESCDLYFAMTKSLNSVSVLKDFFISKNWKVTFAGLNQGRYRVEVVKP